MAHIVSLLSLFSHLPAFANIINSMGFALQFVEMQDQIQSSGALNNSCALNSTCNAWNDFATLNSLVQPDSGV